MDPILDFLLKDPLVVYLIKHPFVILLMFGLFIAFIGHLLLAPKPYLG